MNAARRKRAKGRVGDDFTIDGFFDGAGRRVRRQRRDLAVRVHGRLAGHRFQALVFPEHAENPDFELGRSRISKFWVQRLADRATVANFDRGWDIRPADDTAKAIVDFLAAGIAEHVFGH